MKRKQTAVSSSAKPSGKEIPVCMQDFKTWEKALQTLSKNTKNKEFKKYVDAVLSSAGDAEKSGCDRFRKDIRRQVLSVLKVASDMKKSGKSDAVPFTYYTVNPLSNIKRTAHVYPDDGVHEGEIGIIAAKGEFDPASFVIYPFANAKKVELKISDLKGKKGSIPASAIDLKIVKVWYQAGTAWYSYFADSTGRELVPELLLNDETLVETDVKNRENYLRVKEKGGKPEYLWISATADIDVPADECTQEILDAPSFKPFELKTGEFKQIWLTFEAPKNAEGIYKGKIDVRIDGKKVSSIPLKVRVLPFELPLPMSNYDMSKEYYTSMYNFSSLLHYVGRGAGVKESEERLYNEYVSMRKHNLFHPMLPTLKNPGKDDDLYKKQLKIYKKAGLDTKVIFDGMPAAPEGDYLNSDTLCVPLAKQPPLPKFWLRQVKLTKEYMMKEFGKNVTIYAFGKDEPSMKALRAERKSWKYLSENGVKIYSTVTANHFLHSAYNEDFANVSGYRKEEMDKWHALGVRTSSYSTPHSGPENPDFTRRTYGLDLYLTNTDGTHNYILNGFPWNDFVGIGYNFRSFNFVYPASNGFVETIQYEGFREAIDDVRYATLLKQLANKAVATGKVDHIYKGKMALQWLAFLDGKHCDLAHVRLEMINYILELRKCK